MRKVQATTGLGLELEEGVTNGTEIPARWRRGECATLHCPGLLVKNSATKKQTHLSVADRMLREIIVHSTGSFALEHEVFSDGGTCVWSQELKGRHLLLAHTPPTGTPPLGEEGTKVQAPSYEPSWTCTYMPRIEVIWFLSCHR